MLFGNIADGPQGVNDPKTMADVGNGFPLRRGYTIVWSGWDPDAPRANMGLGLTAPVATDNGKPIVKTVREEFVSGTRGGALEAFKLSYEAATLEQPRARLTVRERADDEPQRAAAQPVVLRRCPLDQAARRHQAQAGLSLRVHTTRPRIPRCRAGLRRDPRCRELAALRSGGGRGHRRHDQPCAGHRLLPGRPLSAPPHLRGLQSRRAGPQGVRRHPFSHIAGVGRIFFNTPFGQPARTNTQHEDHAFPENWFPFSTATLADPLTGKKGSLFRGDGSRSEADRDQHLDRVLAEGRLAAAPPIRSAARTWRCRRTRRVYMIAGTQHGGRAGATDRSRPQRQSAQPAQSDAGRARAAGGARRMGGVGQGAAAQPRADAGRRHPGRARQDGLPGHAGRRRGARSPTRWHRRATG